jgi:hypothetical protein
MAKGKPGRPKKEVKPTINEIDEVVNYWKNVVSSKDEIIEDLEQMIADGEEEEVKQILRAIGVMGDPSDRNLQ